MMQTLTHSAAATARRDDERNILTAARFTDVCIFGLLFAFVMLFQLQVAAPWISRLMVREALYAVVYLRIIFYYRLKYPTDLMFILIFLFYAFCVALHTHFLFGSTMALAGFMRFVNVALLAPPAAVFFTSMNQVRHFVHIWLAVYLLGAVSLFYQAAGGNLQWLFEDYMSVRGTLARYMTILGEPNIGGMATVVVVMLTFLGIRSSFWKWLLIMVSIAFLIFSISKAALLGLIVAGFIIFFYRYRQLVLTRKVLFVSLAVLTVILCFLILALDTEIAGSFREYGAALAQSFVGTQSTGEASPSFWVDIWYRIYFKVMEGVNLSQTYSDIYFLNILAGSSYGVAGTAAVYQRGHDVATLPHNGFLEVFLVGGMFMLFIFLWILLVTVFRLQAISVKSNYAHALFVSFLILVLFNTGYPVFNQPFLGSFFWLMVGVAANKNVLKDAYRVGGAMKPVAAGNQ